MLTAVGGEGLDGYGGNGGYWYVENYAGGDIQILNSGSVNTYVTLPTQPPYLGTHPVEITANTTLEVGTTGLHLVAGDAAVYDGTDVVTGIHVAAGATLTIKPNFPAAGLRSYAYFNLDDALAVDGTVKLATVDGTTPGDGLGTDTAGFQPYYLGSLWIAETGSIDLSGAASTSGAGANGGWFTSYADVFYNAGTLTTAGGAGSDGGGQGGEFYVYTNEGFAVSTGTIVTDGGAGGTGAGGSAGALSLEAGNYGYTVAKGTVSAIGGDGDDGGGNGGNLYFYTSDGDMILAGTFLSHGGNATSDGNGGTGGYFYPEADGNLRIAGDVDTHGGDGAGTGNGGTGGYFEVYTYPDYGWDTDYEPNSQGMLVGASFNLGGGSGVNGGDAGYVYLYAYDDYDGQVTPLQASPIKLVGYPTIDLSGGNGTTDGGWAGSYYNNYNGVFYYNYNYLYAGEAYDDNGDYTSGSIVNQVDWVMKGGNGASGAGGHGAGLEMETAWAIVPPYTQSVKNSGNLDGSGGDGGTTGGNGGYFYLYGDFGLENSGAITANGGHGDTGAGYATYLYLESSGPIACSGALTANGGSSKSGNGAYGANVYVDTPRAVTGMCTITANGGDSTEATAGDGGYVWVQSQDAASRVGAISVVPGTGANGTPVNGEAYVDGMQIAGP